MTNRERVLAFIAAWEARDIEAIMRGLARDAVYLNVGLSEARGHDAIRAAVTPFLAGARTVRWAVHHIAETSAGAVLTERTDDFVMGAKTISVPVMGVFEFKDGLIAAWRDYFDLPGFQAQMA
jgi:limonene-1,2-epoxide hydrolase